MNNAATLLSSASLVVLQLEALGVFQSDADFNPSSYFETVRLLMPRFPLSRPDGENKPISPLKDLRWQSYYFFLERLFKSICWKWWDVWRLFHLQSNKHSDGMSLVVAIPDLSQNAKISTICYLTSSFLYFAFFSLVWVELIYFQIVPKANVQFVISQPPPQPPQLLNPPRKWTAVAVNQRTNRGPSPPPHSSFQIYVTHSCFFTSSFLELNW